MHTLFPILNTVPVPRLAHLPCIQYKVYVYYVRMRVAGIIKRKPYTRVYLKVVYYMHVKTYNMLRMQKIGIILYYNKLS